MAKTSGFSPGHRGLSAFLIAIREQMEMIVAIKVCYTPLGGSAKQEHFAVLEVAKSGFSNGLHFP